MRCYCSFIGQQLCMELFHWNSTFVTSAFLLCKCIDFIQYYKWTRQLAVVRAVQIFVLLLLDSL